MRKFLVALFLMLIVGFGFVGYTQITDESEEVINPKDTNTINIQS